MSSPYCFSDGWTGVERVLAPVREFVVSEQEIESRTSSTSKKRFIVLQRRAPAVDPGGGAALPYRHSRGNSNTHVSPITIAQSEMIHFSWDL